MLDKDQGIVGLLRDGHELGDREGPPDLQHGEPAAKLTQDLSIVPAGVKDTEPM